MATQLIGRDIIAFQQVMSEHPAPGPDRHLVKDELLIVADGDWRLDCLAGSLWLTRDGDQEDYILRPGDRLAIRRGDRAVAQALRPARIRLSARH